MIEKRKVCFGIPTMFSFGSKSCGACPDFGACRREAHDALKATEHPAAYDLLLLHERETLVGAPCSRAIPAHQPRPTARPKGRLSRSKFRHIPLTESQKQVLLFLPLKAADLLERLWQRGYDAEIATALREHRNLRSDLKIPAALRVAIARLPKGFDRVGLRSYLEVDLRWSRAAACNETSMLWKVLPALGIAIEKHGCLFVDPKLIDQPDP